MRLNSLVVMRNWIGFEGYLEFIKLALGVGTLHNPEIGWAFRHPDKVTDIRLVDVDGENLLTEVVGNEIDQFRQVIVGADLNIVRWSLCNIQ